MRKANKHQHSFRSLFFFSYGLIYLSKYRNSNDSFQKETSLICHKHFLFKKRQHFCWSRRRKMVWWLSSLAITQHLGQGLAQ